jgi:hypothetical protein
MQTMGTPNKILKAHIKSSRVTVIQISRDLGVSPARVYQWLDGERIPEVRIRNWLFDPATPGHIRDLAKEMLKDVIPS